MVLKSILLLALSLGASRSLANNTAVPTAPSAGNTSSETKPTETKPVTQNKRVASLNWLPEGRCQLKPSVLIPGTNIRIYDFQIFTSRRGTGCKAGEKSTWWNKCDVRKNETDAGSEPVTDVVIRMIDPKTYKKGFNMVFSMLKEVERRAFVDRYGNYLGFYETTARESVEIDQDTVHIVAKRQIRNGKENKIVAELQFFKPGDKEKVIKSKLLHKVSCETEFTDKSF